MDGGDADDLLFLDVALHLATVDVDLFAALLDEHDAHRLAEVGAGGAQHLLATRVVERDGDAWTLVGGGGDGIDELVAGDDDVALEEHRLTVVLVQLRADRRAVALHGLGDAVLLVLQAPLEGRDLAEDVLHLGGVLDARQLYDDAVDALALHHGLGDTEFIDAVTQGGEVLLDGVVLPLADLQGREQHLQGRTFRRGHLGVGEIGQDPAQRSACRVEVRPGRQQYPQTVRLRGAIGHRRHIGEGEVRAAECAAHILFVDLEQLRDRPVDVHLVEEVQAATQIEAERHRPQADRAQPIGGARGERQGSRVFLAIGLIDGITRLQLLRDRVKVQHQTALVLIVTRHRHAAVGEQPDHLAAGVGSDGGAVLAHHLQRGILAEHVRQRDHGGHQQHHRDQPILPAREFEHGSALQGALGHERTDLKFLDLDLHILGDLERDHALADRAHLAEDATHGSHLVTDRQRREHGLVFLGLFLLRTDEEEIEDDDEQHHHQERRELAAG